jgi:hypothetical protein
MLTCKECKYNNTRFKFSGFDEYINEAYPLREEYNFQLNSPMNQFSVRNKGELVTGPILKFYPHHAKAKRKFDVRQQVMVAVKDVRVRVHCKFQKCVQDAIAAQDNDKIEDYNQGYQIPRRVSMVLRNLPP